MKPIIIKKIDILNFFLYLIILFPLFKIPYLTIIMPKMATIYNLASLLSFFLILILCLKKRFFSKFSLMTFLFCGLILFSTYIKGADTNQAISLVISIITISLVIEYGLKNHTKVFLNATEFLLYSYVFINFLSVLLYPNGMYASSSISFYTTNNWFLGFKNNHITLILPAILVSLVNSYITKNKISLRCYILFFISLYTLIFVKSSTSIVSIFIVIILLFIYKTKKKNIEENKKVTNFKPISINSYLFSYLAVFIGIVVLRLQNIFKFLIVDILKKDITFTGRIYIWDYVFEFIKSSFLLGYGIEDSTVRYLKTNYYPSYHAHNLILEIFYIVGLLGIIVIGYIFYLTIQELKKCKRKDISTITFIILFAFLVIGITEFYSLENLFIYLSFSYNVKHLCKGDDEFARQ